MRGNIEAFGFLRSQQGAYRKKDSPTSICSAGMVVTPIVSWRESLLASRLTFELRAGAAEEQSERRKESGEEAPIK